LHPPRAELRYGSRLTRWQLLPSTTHRQSLTAREPAHPDQEQLPTTPGDIHASGPPCQRLRASPLPLALASRALASANLIIVPAFWPGRRAKQVMKLRQKHKWAVRFGCYAADVAILSRALRDKGSFVVRKADLPHADAMNGAFTPRETRKTI
jgi:hypothetical protein